MTYLTTAERERLAYAEGYTETAAVLARLDDAHRALGESVATQVEIDELEGQVSTLEDERDAATYARDIMEEERDDAREQVKTLRAALMAVESEVPAHVRQFIREVLR